MEKKNVVIKVENEREYRALMKYYDSKGWKWINGKEATIKSHAFCDGDGFDRKYIEFMDHFSSDASARTDEFIIPFAHLAAIEGIELEPGEVIIHTNNNLTIKVEPGRCIASSPSDSLIITKETIEEIYSALKSFEK